MSTDTQPSKGNESMTVDQRLKNLEGMLNMTFDEAAKNSMTPNGILPDFAGLLKEYWQKMIPLVKATTIEVVMQTMREAKDMAEATLRKELGMNRDEPLRQSDIPKLLRQMQLEAANYGGKSPAGPEKNMVGPDGNKALLKEQEGSTKSQIDALLESYGVREVKK